MTLLMVFETLNRAYLQTTSFIDPQGTIKRIIYQEEKRNFILTANAFISSLTTSLLSILENLLQAPIQVSLCKKFLC